jgi:hypothetical protein
VVGLSKIVKELQTITKSNMLGNGNMCKTQWNCINNAYKEFLIITKVLITSSLIKT